MTKGAICFVLMYNVYENETEGIKMKKMARRTHNRRYTHRKKRYKKNRKLLKLWCFLIFVVGSFFIGRNILCPFEIGLDAGHGGEDVGAQGIINEVELTEKTTAFLEEILKEDGRFRVVLSRKYGEGKGINERNAIFQRKNPDIVLSIHGNADATGVGHGFECYPSPPGRKNYESSYIFAQMLANEMQQLGSTLRGSGGIRYGYYIPDGTGNMVKTIVEANDVTEYEYGSFGMVEGMDCPAVLLEQCFVTNENDVLTFATEEGCRNAAKAYYQAICKYLGIEAKV